jgi:hypothetical protein
MSSITFGKAIRRKTAMGANFVPDMPEGLLDGFQRVTATITLDMESAQVTTETTFDRDTNSNGVYGRDGVDTDGDLIPDTPVSHVEPPEDSQEIQDEIGGTIDWGDAESYYINFSELDVRNVVDLASVEINRTTRPWNSCELFYGIRYLDFRDRFSLNGQGSVISPLILNTVAKNQMIGPQIGVRHQTWFYRFRLNLEGRFVPAYNHQTVSQTGEVAGGFSTNPVELISLLPTAIDHSFEKDTFSAIGELRADAILPINQYVAFRFGYTGTVVGGLSYASPKVVYELPSFGIADVESDETLFANAFTVGIDINR